MKAAAWTIMALIVGAMPIGVLLLWTQMTNTELYGRLTETKKVPSAFTIDEDAPTVRLVLHKIVQDENAIEASLVLIVPASSTLANEIKAAGLTAKAVVEDWSSEYMGAMHGETTVLDTAVMKTARGDAVVRSPRFLLPSYPSVETYPLDEQKVRPMLLVETSRGPVSPHIEVQKAFPGRRMAVAYDGGVPAVTFKRSLTEKTFIFTALAVFAALASMLTVGFFLFEGGVSTLEQLVAVASFLLAAAGFRQLLGLDKIPGTTALDLAVISIPLVSLCIVIAASVFRGIRGRGHEQ